MAQSRPPENQSEDIYVANHIWGSPETCIEKLRHVNEQMGTDDFIAVFSYGSMPLEKAEKSMRLFAEKVLPVAQQFEPAVLPAA